MIKSQSYCNICCEASTTKSFIENMRKKTQRWFRNNLFFSCSEKTLESTLVTLQVTVLTFTLPVCIEDLSMCDPLHVAVKILIQLLTFT